MPVLRAGRGIPTIDEKGNVTTTGSVTQGGILLVEDAKTSVRVKAGQTTEFGQITYDRAGTYTSTITEANGRTDGMAYDATEHTVTVIVAPNKDANADVLAAEVTYDGEDSLTVTNTFTAAKATLSATKDFNAWGKVDSFGITLKPVAGAPIPGDATSITMEATQSGPTVTFAEIEYKKAGAYEYTITEEAGNVAGVTYDTTEHRATVTVTEDADDKLTTVVSYNSGSSLTITNTYESGTIRIRKTFSDNAPEEAKNNLEFQLASSLGVTFTITYAEFVDGEYAIDDVPVSTAYTVTETNAEGITSGVHAQR